MMNSLPDKSKKLGGACNGAAFSEMDVWKPFGQGWRKLHGSFQDAGYSVEWHDFTTAHPLDWSSTFHPSSLEICLNLSGHADVRAAGQSLELAPLTAGFYAQNDSSLTAAGGMVSDINSSPSNFRCRFWTAIWPPEKEGFIRA
jgi:hypothetical protein